VGQARRSGQLGRMYRGVRLSGRHAGAPAL